MRSSEMDPRHRSRRDEGAEAVLEEREERDEYGQPVRHRRHRNGVYRGRRQILFIYIAATISYVILLLAAPERIRAHMLPEVGKTMLWSTVLGVAIWLRHKWARFVMSFLEVATVVLMVVIFPEFYMPGPEIKNPFYLWIVGLYFLIHVAIAWILLASGDLKRLTSLSYRR